MLQELAEEQLLNYQQQGLARRKFVISNRENSYIHYNGKQLVNFCSNDYLSLANEPSLITALQTAVAEHGIGSSASAVVTKSQICEKFEHKMAGFLNKEETLLCSSGFLANIAAIATIANSSYTIFYEQNCHASLIDAMLLSRAKLCKYRNLEQLQRKLKISSSTNNMVVTDSVLSVTGELIDIEATTAIAAQYDAVLIVDDSHGVGVIGHGVCSKNNYKNLIATCSLGKAFAAMGGVIAASSKVIEILRQAARGYMYTTAAMPAIAAHGIAVIDIIQQQNWRNNKLQENIELFNNKASKLAIDITGKQTAIKSILQVNNNKNLKIQDCLIEQGFLVALFRYPSVARGQIVLRVSINCMHSKQQIAQLLHCIKKSIA